MSDPLRIGGARGSQRGTLEGVISAIEGLYPLFGGGPEPGATLADVVGRLDTVITKIEELDLRVTNLHNQVAFIADATGNRQDTTCNMSELELLCAIATALGVEPGPGAPDAPPFNCGIFTNDRYIQTSAWSNTGLEAFEGVDAFYASYYPAVGDTTAYVTDLQLQGDTAPHPTIVLPPPDRTVCMTAVNGDTVPIIQIRRWHIVTQLDGGVIYSATSPSDPIFSAGATVNFDGDWLYRVYVVRNSGDPAPTSATSIWYAEGGLG